MPNIPFQIVFAGTRGKNFKGDIALDDVSLTDGTCRKYIVILPL